MPGLDDFIGQSAIKDLIRPKIRIARAAETTLPHLLICGGKEQGKRTFATALAEELEVPFTGVSAESLEKRLDLTGILSNTRAHQILAVNNVEALRPQVLDALVQGFPHFALTFWLAPGCMPFRCRNLRLWALPANRGWWTNG
jgi:holliday junction DNA helicase RuvB